MVSEEKGHTGSLSLAMSQQDCLSARCKISKFRQVFVTSLYLSNCRARSVFFYLFFLFFFAQIDAQIDLRHQSQSQSERSTDKLIISSW